MRKSSVESKSSSVLERVKETDPLSNSFYEGLEILGAQCEEVSTPVNVKRSRLLGQGTSPATAAEKAKELDALVDRRLQ